ncbi:MAG: type II secretion system protein [Phycisphaerales bacterium]
MRCTPFHPDRADRRGFTLVEMLATLVVVGTVAAITSPIVVGATQAFAKSASQRRAAEQVAGALDRLSRVLREAPAKSSPAGAADFASAAADNFALSNGLNVTLSGSTLMLGSTTVKGSPLCQNVTAFQITYLDSAGAAVSVASGTDSVRRVVIRLAAQGVDLSTTVWLRASLNET